MKKKDLLQEALGLIDDELILDAKKEQKPTRKAPHRTIIVAACIALLVAAIPIGFLIAKITVPSSFYEDTEANAPFGEDGRELWIDTREEKNDFQLHESGHIWEWKYLDLYEKYHLMRRKGVNGEYCFINSRIPTSLLGERLGSATAYGYDYYEEKTHELACEVYSIKGVENANVVAVKLKGTDEYWTYKIVHGEYDPPATLGEFINKNDLTENLPLTVFYNREDTVLHALTEADSTHIWSILTACSDAVFVEDDPIHDNVLDKIDLRNGVGFTLNSTVLGIVNKAFTVFADGYVFTNVEEYGYYFYIGKDAAAEIIAYAREKGTPYEEKAEICWIAGTITEIGEDYFKINDAILMQNEADGIEFTVKTTSIKILRYFQSGILRVGDTAAVRYDGLIYADAPTIIEGALGIDPCTIVDGDAYIPE